jgi:hypothetical protein
MNVNYELKEIVAVYFKKLSQNLPEVLDEHQENPHRIPFCGPRIEPGSSNETFPLTTGSIISIQKPLQVGILDYGFPFVCVFFYLYGYNTHLSLTESISFKSDS